MNKVLFYISYGWRVAATGVCFSLFGLGALVLSLGWFNLLSLAVRDRERRLRMARRSISLSFRLFLRICSLLQVFDYRFEGFDKIGWDRGVLLVANHPTLVDYVLIASRLPETDCLVKSGLMRNPFLRGVVKSADYLVNDRHEELLGESGERLGRGENILIFPEGTRTTPGSGIKLKRGCANIALRCHCDIRIINIKCSEYYLTKNTKWYHLPVRKPHFTVSAGERISIETFMQEHQASAMPLLARRLTSFLKPQLEFNL